jgi:hypothetical protein
MDRFELEIRAQDLPRTEAGNPALPTKNTSFKPGRVGGRRSGRATILKTALHKRFIARMSEVLLRRGVTCSKAVPMIVDGTWRLTLVAYAPRRRGKTDLPLLDSDACLSPVRDALTACGVWGDDIMTAEDRSITLYRKGDPGLWICLERLSEADLAKLREDFLGA